MPQTVPEWPSGWVLGIGSRPKEGTEELSNIMKIKLDKVYPDWRPEYVKSRTNTNYLISGNV